ncbi:hypothetical protein [Pseudonocardia sp. NPDC049635]|uniref:hypothetical protein n=1 Tax=Pseudonocardia sp. NPDC049635 TaxID=3155506 RepID=UPI0034003A29
MSDHHQRSDDTPLYGDGPGVTWPDSFTAPPVRTQAFAAYTRPGPLGSRAEQLADLLDRLGDELTAAAETVAALSVLLSGPPRPAPPPPDDGQDDLTETDHLVADTVKDTPYGTDSGLVQPAQTWTGGPW